MIVTTISIYLFISLIVTTFLSAFLRSREKVDYTGILFALGIAIDIYLFGYLLELSSTYMDQKLFWNLFQYLGIPFVSALWLTLALVYTRKLDPNRYLKLFLIFFVPALTFLYRFTNTYHHLYFTSFELHQFGELSLLMKGKGIWYYVQSFHSGSSIILSFLFFTLYFIKNKNSDSEKTIYLICTSLFSCTGLILNITGIGGLKIDYMVLFLPFAMVFIVMAIFRNDFLEVRILAREHVFEKNQEGIVLVNRNGHILDFNEAAISIFQSQHIELAKKSLDAVFHSDLAEIMRAAETKTWTVESSHGIHYYEFSSTDITQNGIVLGRIKTIRDTTEIQLRTNYLKRQATIDELSGLLNRREFMNLCQSHLNMTPEDGSIFCLLMLDIDYFKNINDSFGHMAGDIVISTLGKLLHQNFRTTDLVGRLGGEEFAVFVKVMNLQQAYAKAEHLRKTVEKMELISEGKSIKTTVSIGIAAAGCAESISKLMSHADKALYVSKESGRNKTSIYQESALQ
ncbi:MAG: diguanylate cyclase [Kiritimatiellales bacterium]